MRKNLASNSISKSVIWQLAGKFALQGVYFITTPIFTRVLTPTDYGYTALYTSWLSIFSLIIGLQAFGSIGNARIKFGEENLNRYTSSIMSISVLSFFIILPIGYFFRRSISFLLRIRIDLVILVILQSFFDYIFRFYIAKLDQLKKVEKSTIISLCSSIFSVGFGLLFCCIVKDNKAFAKIYGQALASLIFAIPFFIIIYAQGKEIWNSEYNKYCIIFILPLVIHGIGHLIFGQTDRIMLQRMKGEDVLGIYSVSFSLCSILTIIYGALNTAWLPFYYDFKKKNEIFEILRHSKRYIKFFSIITIGFVLLAQDIFKIMAPESYFEGIKNIPLFTMANYFSFLYLFPVNFEFFYSKTNLIPIATFSAAVINILINLLLIPKYGLLGAALGTLFAHIILFLFHELVSRFVIKENYDYKNMLLFLFPSVIVLGFCLIIYVFNIHWIIRWLIAVVLGIYVLFTSLREKSIF